MQHVLSDVTQRLRTKEGEEMEVKSFLNGHCPYYDRNDTDGCYFCDGTPMGTTDNLQKKEPCKYLKFAGTFKSGCNHPNRHKKQK